MSSHPLLDMWLLIHFSERGLKWHAVLSRESLIKGDLFAECLGNSRSRRSIRRYQCRNLALQWSHNERYDVSNHRRFEFLFNLLFMQRSASLAFVRGVHRWPMDSPHKGPGTRKMFPFDDVNMKHRIAVLSYMMDMMILSWENKIMMTETFSA